MNALRLNKILLGFAVLLSFFIGILPVFTGNVYFGFDQGLDTVLVKQLVSDHDLSLISRYSGLAGVLMGPLWSWILAIPFAISGGNPVANIIFLNFLRLACAGILFWFLKKYFSWQTAVISFLLVIFSPIFIYYSQVSASPHPLGFLMVFYVWFAYEILVNKKLIYWLPIGLLIGVFFQLEIAFALFALPVIIRWRHFKTKEFWLGMLLLGITFIPQILFDLRHDFLISRSLLGYFLGDQNLYSSKYVLPFPERFFDRAKTFLDDFVRNGHILLIPVILAGAWTGVKNKAREIKLLQILGIFIFVYFVGFSFYPGPLWDWYRSGFHLVYLLLISLSLGILWSKNKLVVIILVILIIVSKLEIKTGLDNNPAVLTNQKAAIDYVYNLADGREFSYFAYTAPVYDYVWQYDFWWYGKSKYGYLPKNWQMGVPLLGMGKQSVKPTENEGLFYVIAEPDPERPWQTDGWLKTYIKVGKINQEKIFPSGIIVQERITP